MRALSHGLFVGDAGGEQHSLQRSALASEMQLSKWRTLAPGNSWPLVIVEEYRLSAGEPSGCLASAGRLGKLMYFASPRVLDVIS